MSIPDMYFENYNSFSLLYCRILHACMSGSSRLFFMNTRAASQTPENSFPQQLSFKLCAQSSLKASSAHRTNSLGSVPFWRRWEQMTNLHSSPFAAREKQSPALREAPAENVTKLELHMQKPNPTSPAFINPSVQTFPQEAEPNFFRPCSTSPKLQLTQLCQLTSAGDDQPATSVLFHGVRPTLNPHPCHTRVQLNKFQPLLQAWSSSCPSCSPTNPPSQAAPCPSASQWHLIRISPACAWLPTLTCT